MPEFLFNRKVNVVVAVPLDVDTDNLAAAAFGGAAAGGFGKMSAQAIEIKDLRVQFKVEKTLDKHPNTAEIQITNLAERTRASLQNKAAKILLKAGHETTLAQIFYGDVTIIDHTRDGADWVTKIQCGDGERGFLHARVSESYKAGTPVSEIVTRLSQAMGLDIGNAIAKAQGLASQQFVNGYVAHGPASKELGKVLKAAGYEFSIQDGRLQVLKPGETNTERIVTLSSASGLIGSPEYGTPDKKTKKSVIKVKSLLIPDLLPGGRVNLDSERHKGIHKILKLSHTGDTAGNDWYTEMEMEVV